MAGPNLPKNVVLIQYFLAFSGHLGAFIMAAVWSFSSTALPSLRVDDQMGPQVTQFVEDWIASVTFLAGAAGSFACGYLAQRFGLKRSLQFIAVPLLIGWILVAAAQNVSMLMTGRLITGFCVAGVGVSCNIVAELAHKSIRGRLNIGFDLMFCFGVLFIYVVGTFFSWRTQAASCAGVTLIWFVLLFVIPESPRSLYERGAPEKARQALAWAQRLDDPKDVDMSEYETTESLEEKGAPTGTNFWEQVFTLDVWKPIIIVVALQFFLQMCGVVPIVCYAVDVFKSAGGHTVHENLYMIIFGAVNLGATFVACLCVDKAGRRLLMMGSEASLTLTLLILGVFLYLRDSVGVPALQSWEWFPCVCLVLYITGYSFGVGPIPWVISGEILHHSAKGFSNGVVIVLTRIFGFLAMFYFKSAINVMGQWGVYWFFAVVCFLGLLFSYFFLPETKGLKLEQIEMSMKDGWLQHNRPPLVNMDPEGREYEPVENGPKNVSDSNI
ncbi:unnamed protein product [Allacma fusca]|uniref:Major facilitator superfamily (MFS) profile domain-containing protein n=1 Tax=Allacma fusca TaxID=39272 RepID=A0A8J2MAG6_9HEXA|nr:unnamed protein product [Allacma fusca]